jgi:hypothetical protein
MFGLAAVLGVLGLVITALRVQAFAERGLIGVDFRLFSSVGERWLETGSMYQPYQFAGPYAFDRAAGTNAVWDAPALYPPIAAPLFAGLRLLGPLAAVLWWAVPCGVLVYALYRWRPAPWTWPVLALPLLWPSTAAPFLTGNTTMLVAAGVAGGLMWGWPVLIVALKPTFAPFLLLGVKRRSWWLGAALLAVLSLTMLDEWVRYVTVLRNVTGAGLLYSVADLPLVMVPVVAWLGRPSTSCARASSGSGGGASS